jgi:hypothetical protein
LIDKNIKMLEDKIIKNKNIRVELKLELEKKYDIF